MQTVVLMAGAGRRFADAGYRQPKPLISLAGLPMAVRAARALPPGRRTVFVCRAEHIREHAADAVLRRHLPGCEVVVAHGPTEGPADSARLALGRLDEDRPVLLAGCDRVNVFDPTRFEELTTSGADCIVWTFHQDPRVLVAPEDHCWADVGPGGRVRGVSVRVPLSDWQYHDHACAGVLWFRAAGLLEECLRGLIASGRRIHGEFHPEGAAGLLARKGGDVRSFLVEKHVALSTPEDMAEFRRWEACLASLAAA